MSTVKLQADFSQVLNLLHQHCRKFSFSWSLGLWSRSRRWTTQIASRCFRDHRGDDWMFRAEHTSWGSKDRVRFRFSTTGSKTSVFRLQMTLSRRDFWWENAIVFGHTCESILHWALKLQDNWSGKVNLEYMQCIILLFLEGINSSCNFWIPRLLFPGSTTNVTFCFLETATVMVSQLAISIWKSWRRHGTLAKERNGRREENKILRF